MGYQQKAREGASSKTEHEADSLRAIRRYLTGKLSWEGGVQAGWGREWSFDIAFIRN